MIISPEVNFVSYFRYSYAYIHESFVYILRPFLLKKHSLLLTVRKNFHRCHYYTVQIIRLYG
jgi:hypothetical protein